MQYKEAQSIFELPPRKLMRLAHQIGNTPMHTIELDLQGQRRKIHLKLEGANPTGSMKDRTGYALIQDLEERKLLKANSIIVESTSGNLGVALSFQCRARGYDFIAVVDPKTTQENIHKIHLLNAQIERVEEPDGKGGYLLSRLARVRELCQRSSQYIWTDQYNNLANPTIHYEQTAREIYEQMNFQVDALFVPVSTGGTLAGVGRFFRTHSPITQVIGVDAYGSVVFGLPAARRKLTGIGSSRPSSFLHPDLYKSYCIVHDEEAFACCRALQSTTGIPVGGSSGAVIYSCIRYLVAHPELTHIVCVCADHGGNYRSTIFNDAWLLQQAHELDLERLYQLQAELQQRIEICQAHSTLGVPHV